MQMQTGDDAVAAVDQLVHVTAVVIERGSPLTDVRVDRVGSSSEPIVRLVSWRLPLDVFAQRPRRQLERCVELVVEPPDDLDVGARHRRLSIRPDTAVVNGLILVEAAARLAAEMSLLDQLE
jgi:hypothetical protein